MEALPSNSADPLPANAKGPAAAKQSPTRARAVFVCTLAGTLFGVYLLIIGALVWQTLRPKPAHFAHTPAERAWKYSDASFTSVDGTKLSGWYVLPAHLPPRGGIVLCHGADGNRNALWFNAKILRRAGYAVLMFDFRARGMSGGKMSTLGYREVDDFRAAVQWMQKQKELQGRPLGAVGGSLGASVVIMGAARIPAVRAIVAEAPFASLDNAVSRHFQGIFGPVWPVFGLPTQWVGEIAIGRRASKIAPMQSIAAIEPRPVLLICDAADELCPPEQIDRIKQRAGKHTVLWTVPKAGHVGATYVAPEQYAQRVTNFFNANLSGVN